MCQTLCEHFYFEHACLKVEKKLKVNSFLSFFAKRVELLRIYSYICARLSQPIAAGRVKTNIDGILRPTKPFVGLADGKRRLRTLSFCAFKLRTFETLHRDNATEVPAWVDYIPTTVVYVISQRSVVNIVTWRGLAALLILGEGQCEGLNAGMGEGRNSHAFSCFH